MQFLKGGRHLACGLLLVSASALAEPNLITVRATDLDPATGQIEISLFNTAENFMKEPVLQGKAPVTGDTVERTFTNVPDGQYAIVVVHDANENGVLDRGFLGIGGEGYGFSNNVRPWFGWPSFDDAGFMVEGADQVIEISLK